LIIGLSLGQQTLSDTGGTSFDPLPAWHAFWKPLPPGQGPNSGANSRHFRPRLNPAVTTVHRVMHAALIPIRVRPALPRALACGTALAMSLVLPMPAGAQASAPGAIESAVADQVRGLVLPGVNLPDTSRPPRVEVEIGKLDPRLRLAPCQRIETQLTGRGVLWGRTRIALHCVEGERPWRVYLPVVVKVFAPALVPVQALAAGTVLTAAHLKLAEVDWADEAQAPFHRAEKLLGRTLSRALRAGEAVRGSDLRTRQWFAAGDTVSIQARGSGFSVSGEGQALNPGIEGQSVRVRTESGRVLTGVPVAQRRVEVQL
jgi:flagellar basal body P-ring formation protein FlgA